MKHTIAALVLSFVVVGCQSANRQVTNAPPPRIEPVPPPLAASELDPHNIENLRTGEALKAYPLGRYVDPSDPNVLHEAHTIYRREAGAAWNLNPNAPTVVPLGPVLAVADPARMPDPLPAELEQKIAEQNQLMVALIEQNEALTAELARLSKELAELRQKNSTATQESVR